MRPLGSPQRFADSPTRSDRPRPKAIPRRFPTPSDISQQQRPPLPLPIGARADPEHAGTGSANAGHAAALAAPAVPAPLTPPSLLAAAAAELPKDSTTPATTTAMASMSPPVLQPTAETAPGMLEFATTPLRATSSGDAVEPPTDVQ